MKLVLNGTHEFEVSSKPTLSGDTLCFPISAEEFTNIPERITGSIVLQDTIVWPQTGAVENVEDNQEEPEENDVQAFILFETVAENWLRYYTIGNVLCFTNIPLSTHTPEEIKAQLSMAVRQQRDILLASTDWIQLVDSQLSDTDQAEVRVYRQELRDIPQQEGFPEEVVWPKLPEAAISNHNALKEGAL